jgi:hypothetical protein
MERTLAVMTLWAWLGSLGLCLILTGFRMPHLVLGLSGFAVVLAAACGHVILNRIYGTRFAEGEVALGFAIFIVSVLMFVAAWIGSREFGTVRIAIGLGGFGALFAALVAYMTLSFGVRGSIARLDEARKRPQLTRQPAK